MTHGSYADCPTLHVSLATFTQLRPAVSPAAGGAVSLAAGGTASQPGWDSVLCVLHTHSTGEPNEWGLCHVPTSCVWESLQPISFSAVHTAWSVT